MAVTYCTLNARKLYVSKGKNKFCVCVFAVLRVWSRTTPLPPAVLRSEAALQSAGNIALIWLLAHCWPEQVRIFHRLFFFSPFTLNKMQIYLPLHHFTVNFLSF